MNTQVHPQVFPALPDIRGHAIDSSRWPDVASVPRSRVKAAIAAKLMKRVARQLPMHVVYP
ncbi:MAG: hypothetical protein ACRDPW_05785, partial [Mycobacteriales bacterium]